MGGVDPAETEAADVLRHPAAPGGAVDELGHHIVAGPGGVERGHRGGGAHQPVSLCRHASTSAAALVGFGSFTSWSISATRVLVRHRAARAGSAARRR